MQYKEVLEQFKNRLAKNRDMELVSLKHGYMIFYWDSVSKSYYQINTLITSPDDLYNILNEELKNHNHQ